MADDSGLRVVLLVVLRCVLPYSDPIARRRVRSRARALVSSTTWPGSQATGGEIAQLALLRLLWLQREAHRAARDGHSESVALLARTVIETCIVGLYCLVTPGAPEKLTNQNAKHLDAMLLYLPARFMSKSIRERMVGAVGTPKREPMIADMAKAVDEAAGDDTTDKLYRAYYAPLSSFFAHGGGISLLRHVDRSNRVSEQPTAAWFRGSALHIIDSSVALLASRIASASGRDCTPFDTYYEAHRGRTITPVFTIGGRGAAAVIAWRRVPGSLVAIRELQSYLDSDRAAADTPADREATVRAAARRCLAFANLPDDAELVDIAVDALVEALGNSPDAS